VEPTLGAGISLGGALGAAAVLVGVAAGWLWFRPALRWVAWEAAATWSLARAIDGRHALSLAWGLRRGAWRLRRMLAMVEDDPAGRHALALSLRRFTGEDLATLLRRMAVIIATGDNERVRELNRALGTASAQWAATPDSAGRQQLDVEMARLRQQMEESRRVSRAWVGLIRSMEETGRQMKALERDLALLGVARTTHLPDFRARLADISTRIQDLRDAYLELSTRR
jgi:hypothetical protein